VEKLINSAYNQCMQKFNSLENLRQGHGSGQHITDLIEDVYDDYQYFLKTRKDPELILYYRDLLSYLVKNYGH
jgi:hypothetical protein